METVLISILILGVEDVAHDLFAVGYLLTVQQVVFECGGMVRFTYCRMLSSCCGRPRHLSTSLVVSSRASCCSYDSVSFRPVVY